MEFMDTSQEKTGRRSKRKELNRILVETALGPFEWAGVNSREETGIMYLAFTLSAAELRLIMTIIIQ
jgi:hypothetical protein